MLGAASALGAVTTLLLAPSASAESGCGQTFFGGEVTTCSASLGWKYDGQARAFKRQGVVDPSGSAARYEYVLNERCGPDGIDCGAAVLPCPQRDGQSGRMYQAQAFLLADTGVRAEAPSILRNVCLYEARTVPLAVVEAAVREEIRRRIPSPLVVSSPPGRSVVNLFTIFSTVPAAEQAIAFTTPVPGEVRAVPEYVWDLGDGLTGVGPGRPFDPAVLPSKNKGYYLGATYAKPGSKHVTVTVTWRVTFRLEGVTSVPLAPIVMTASEDKPIATARAVLVR